MDTFRDIWPFLHLASGLFQASVLRLRTFCTGHLSLRTSKRELLYALHSSSLQLYVSIRILVIDSLPLSLSLARARGRRLLPTNSSH
jgi:hypothetical protein